MTIPITAAQIERTLTIPPRTRDENAITVPINPKKIATTARTKPQNAPTAKLATAAMSAIIDGTLKLACPADVVVSIEGMIGPGGRICQCSRPEP